MFKKEWTEEEIAKVLQRINSEVPKNMQEMIFTEVKKTPTIEFIMQKALEDPLFPEEKKKQIRVLLENGDFSKTKIKENLKVTRQIDLTLGRRINAAIKRGELPPRSYIKKLPWYKKMLSQENSKRI